MNIRELNVGLVPTKEFEFHHTYSALKHFPTLRRNMREMKLLTMRADSMTQSGLNHSKQQLAGLHFPYGGGESIGRSTGGASVRSTRVLDDLKKSSLEEIHSLSDYHRILIENRKSQRSTSSDQRSSSGDSSAHRHSSKGPQPQPHTLNGSSTPFISDDFSYSTLPSIETNSNTIITRATGVQGYMGSVGDFHVDGNSTYEQQQQHPSFSSSALGHNDQSSYDDALSTANAKMTKISTSFNSQNYHSCVRAFQGPLLDMADFATQLKRCLNINLRAVEVAALFEKMDTRHDGRIDGVEFVRYFFALGTAARWAMQIETVTRNIKREKDLRRQKIEEEERIKVWEAEQILNFTDEDFSSAMDKLEQVALRWSADYDPSAQSGLAGFEAYLTPYRFKLQIEKSFGVRLNGAEIGALTKEFSTRSGEHCIDGKLFLKKFFHVKEVAVRKDNAHKQSNHAAKQKTLSLMRTVDHLPKILGR